MDIRDIAIVSDWNIDSKYAGEQLYVNAKGVA
jgi:hypothetical protein